jgi:hypothetical protein
MEYGGADAAEAKELLSKMMAQFSEIKEKLEAYIEPDNDLADENESTNIEQQVRYLAALAYGLNSTAFGKLYNPNYNEYEYLPGLNSTVETRGRKHIYTPDNDRNCSFTAIF